MNPAARSLRSLVAVRSIIGLLLVVASLALPASRPAGATPEPDPSTGFEAIADLDELTGDHADVFRLYLAFFQRQPDPGGALYWIGKVDDCVDLATIADSFAASDEFGRLHGRLDDRAFVELIYRSVLGRASDPAGRDYWTGLLIGGQLTRGGVVTNVSLSPEFVDRNRYPSDGVPSRGCRGSEGSPPDRRVDRPQGRALATVAGLTIAAPSSIIERAGFHQSTHPGALAMSPAVPSPVRLTTMASRGRGTDPRGAIDIVADPDTAITAPVAGTVARAGEYTLYCRHRDGFAVINPDLRPNLEVKVLHIRDVAVRAGQRVEVGDRLAGGPTPFPFQSQIDELTAEPSWPHVHIEVVDPSVPRKRSSGSC